MIRPFEGFDWDALALLSKAPRWSAVDHASVAGRLHDGLLMPAVSLANAVSAPLGERLGIELIVIPEVGGSVSPLEVREGWDADATGQFVDYTLITFTVSDSDTWLRLRVGHDTVGFACGASLDRDRLASWQRRVADQRSVSDALIHHPTLSVIGFTPEATPSPPPPRRPTPFPLPPPPPSPALVGPAGPGDVRIGWHDPLPPTSTLARFAPFCIDRLAEFAPMLALLRGLS